MIIPYINARVGESLPIRYSFLSRMKSFLPGIQVLSSPSIAWTSQTPLVATFDIGSGALVTSNQALADGISNDAVLGRFTILASGLCTVYCSVAATSPTATYVGVMQFQVEAIPSP